MDFNYKNRSPVFLSFFPSPVPTRSNGFIKSSLVIVIFGKEEICQNRMEIKRSRQSMIRSGDKRCDHFTA